MNITHVTNMNISVSLERTSGKTDNSWLLRNELRCCREVGECCRECAVRCELNQNWASAGSAAEGRSAMYNALAKWECGVRAVRESR